MVVRGGKKMQDKRKENRVSDKYKGVEAIPFEIDDFVEIRYNKLDENLTGKELIAEVIKNNLGIKVTKEPDFNKMVDVVYDALLLKAKEDKDVADWVMHYLNPIPDEKVIH